MLPDEIVDRIRALPPVDDGSFWDKRRSELREKILTEPISEFLRWPTVESTMFVGNAPYIDDELAALPAHYVDAIREPGLGAATLYNSRTSGNLIHQAYHLSRWEMVAGQSVADLQSIVEFGGGYGAMALIVMQLGFRGGYQMIDLPEFAILQQYYLSHALPDIRQITWSDQPADCDLFVASHSLSETSVSVRDKILSEITAESYLFVYHHEHESVDNLGYFAEFAARSTGYRWQSWATDHLPNQRYMMGVKNESSR